MITLSYAFFPRLIDLTLEITLMPVAVAILVVRRSSGS
jgi:hypothetical protein